MTVALSLDAPRQVRASLERYSDRIEQSLFDDLRILSGEIVTNAVQHSGRPEGDPIDISLTITPEVIRMAVTDQGDGVESLHPRPSVPPSGLAHVESLSDRWSSKIIKSFLVWFEIDTHTVEVIKRRPVQLTVSALKTAFGGSVGLQRKSFDRQSEN